MLRNENHGITDTDHEIVKQAVLSSVSSTSGYFSYSSDDPLRNKLSYNLQFLLSLKWSSWLHTGKLKRQASIVWTLLEYRQSSVLCALLWGDRSGPWSLTWLSACIIHNKVNRKLYTLQARESSICLFVFLLEHLCEVLKFISSTKTQSFHDLWRREPLAYTMSIRGSMKVITNNLFCKSLTKVWEKTLIFRHQEWKIS